MGVVVAHVGAGRGAFDPSLRGYQVLFRANETNRCPGCGRAQWYVGRVTAECVMCGTALPLAEAHWGESGSTWLRGGVPVARRLPPESVDPAERRRHAREPGDGRIVQLLIDGAPRCFEVYNLSDSGVMVGASNELVGAQMLELIAPDGEIVGAKIRWTGNALSGLEFNKPLPSLLAAPVLLRE